MRCFRAQRVGSNSLTEIVRRVSHGSIAQQALLSAECLLLAPKVGVERPDAMMTNAQG